MQFYLENEQLEKGDLFYDIKCNDYSFTLSDTLKHKDILLIFYGLNCMGEYKRNLLKSTYESLDYSKVDIVYFSYAPDKVKLNQLKEKYDIPWLMISDYQQDHSKSKVIYDVQTTPTVVYIGSDVIIKHKQTGICKKND